LKTQGFVQSKVRVRQKISGCVQYSSVAIQHFQSTDIVPVILCGYYYFSGWWLAKGFVAATRWVIASTRFAEKSCPLVSFCQNKLSC